MGKTLASEDAKTHASGTQLRPRRTLGCARWVVFTRSSTRNSADDHKRFDSGCDCIGQWCVG